MSDMTPVGRSKRKIIIESSNFSREDNLSTSVQDQFRKDYDFLWKQETISKGSYGTSYSSVKDTEGAVTSFHNHSADSYLPVHFRFSSDDLQAKLLIGPKLTNESSNPMDPDTRVYSLNIQHIEGLENYDPLSDQYNPSVIRHILPVGQDSAGLASLVYGTHAYYVTCADDGQLIPTFISPTRDEFVFDTLSGVDPGPAMFATNIPFMDNLISMEAPYNVKGGEELDVNDLIFFDVKSNFEYSQPEYIGVVTKTPSNSTTSAVGFDERLLPNFYHVVSDYAEAENRFKKTVLLAGAIDESLAPYYLQNRTNNKAKKPYMLKNREYFSTYATKLSDILAGRPLKVSGEEVTFSSEYIFSTFISRSKNVIVTNKNWDYLTEHKKHIDEFPLYVELSFRSEINSGLSEMFSDLDLDEALIKTLISSHEQADEDQSILLSGDADYAPRELLSSGADLFSTKTYSVGSIGDSLQLNQFELNEFDFESWLSAFKKFTGTNDRGLNVIKQRLLDSNASFIGKEDSELSDSSRSKFLRTFMTLIAESKVKALAAKNKRDFIEVLRGKPCYSETLVYKVCKHVVTEDGRVVAKPIQRFWISNNPETEVINFYDTQVKFDAKYKYIVYAYKLVVGAEYKYLSKPRPVGRASDVDPEGLIYSPNIISTDIDANCRVNPFAMNINQTNISVQVEVKPTIKLIEVPYYGTDVDDAATVRLYDDPPLPPNIEIVPYVGVDDMFLLNLNSAIGYNEQHVKVIEPGDMELFEKVREYQERGPDDPVIFSNDDNPALFEIYRIEPDPITNLTSAPKDYTDFSGKLLQTIEGPYVSVKQKVKPNKKYYYTFRSIDARGNISNPSPVYEIQMAGNELMFPVIKEYVFPSKLTDHPVRPARRFLYIKPNYEQVEVDAVKSGFEDTATKGYPILGTLPEEPLFSSEGDNSKNKRFKIRLTSKKSGKKIDFNVRFKHEHENFK